MLLSYPHPIVRSRLLTPRNTPLLTQMQNRSPKCRSGRQTTMTMKSAFLLNWTINCLRNSFLVFESVLCLELSISTLFLAPLPSVKLCAVRKNALLNHFVFLIKANITHSLFSTVHSSRTSSFQIPIPKILHTVCHATFYLYMFRIFLIPFLVLILTQLNWCAPFHFLPTKTSTSHLGYHFWTCWLPSTLLARLLNSFPLYTITFMSNRRHTFKTSLNASYDTMLKNKTDHFEPGRTTVLFLQRVCHTSFQACLRWCSKCSQEKSQ